VALEKVAEPEMFSANVNPIESIVSFAVSRVVHVAFNQFRGPILKLPVAELFVVLVYPGMVIRETLLRRAEFQP
jgi:hypothetical protein